ncbi:hypothetical protein ACOMHN_012727 [Nucella lapillus]
MAGAAEKRLFVGGLVRGVSEDELVDKFSRFGQVTSLEVKTRVTDADSSKTFAYLNLTADDNAFQKCFTAYNNTKWKGGQLKVQFAKESFLSRLKKEQAKSLSPQQESIRQPAPIFRGPRMDPGHSAVPGTPLDDQGRWVMGQHGCPLPVLRLRKPGSRKLVTVDPSKMCLKKLRSEDYDDAQQGSLTWELEENLSPIHRLRQGLGPPGQPPTHHPARDQASTQNHQASTQNHQASTQNHRSSLKPPSSLLSDSFFSRLQGLAAQERVFHTEMEVVPIGHVPRHPTGRAHSGPDSRPRAHGAYDSDSSAGSADTDDIVCRASGKKKDGIVCQASGKKKDGIVCRASGKKKDGIVCQASGKKKDGIVCRASGKKKDGIVCQASGKKKDGIVCQASGKKKDGIVCQASGKKKDGIVCQASGDKKDGIVCQASGKKKDGIVCQASGKKKDGIVCQASGKKKDGIVCQASGKKKPVLTVTSHSAGRREDNANSGAVKASKQLTNTSCGPLNTDTPGSNSSGDKPGNKTVPSDNKRTPCDSKRTPSDNKRTPSDNKRTPCDSKRTPCDSKRTPCDSKRTPSDNKRTPSDNKRTPCDNKRTPSDNKRPPFSMTPEFQGLSMLSSDNDDTESPIRSTDGPQSTGKNTATVRSTDGPQSTGKNTATVRSTDGPQSTGKNTATVRTTDGPQNRREMTSPSLTSTDNRRDRANNRREMTSPSPRPTVDRQRQGGVGIEPAVPVLPETRKRRAPLSSDDSDLDDNDLEKVGKKLAARAVRQEGRGDEDSRGGKKKRPPASHTAVDTPGERSTWQVRHMAATER